MAWSYIPHNIHFITQWSCYGGQLQAPANPQTYSQVTLTILAHTIQALVPDLSECLVTDSQLQYPNEAEGLGFVYGWPNKG